MKAYVFDGKESAKLEERPVPNIIKQSDVIVKIEKTTICGTDLHRRCCLNQLNLFRVLRSDP
ncbi:hypothetical protein ACED34_20835, partial [Vibrio splendidus]